MQLTKITPLVAAAALASANSITFVNQDSTARTVYFTANPGKASIDAVEVPGNKQSNISIPHAWAGNFYSISEGSDDIPGMLGEATFDSDWDDLHFFDVSAIVSTTDIAGVQMLYPVGDEENASGCDGYSLPLACDNVYIESNDVQTKSTSNPNLVCTLGTSVVNITTRAVAPETAKFPRAVLSGLAPLKMSRHVSRHVARHRLS